MIQFLNPGFITLLQLPKRSKVDEFMLTTESKQATISLNDIQKALANNENLQKQGRRYNIFY